MTGSVLQLNISSGGVPKHAIPSAYIGPLGLEGDRHNHPNIHGGPEKAVLLVTAESLEEMKELGFAVYPGAIGENITSFGLDRRHVRVGQRYRIGPEVFIEISRMRAPCKTLDSIAPGIQSHIYDAAVKAGDPSSPLWGRAGFYARVLQAGTVRPGDIILLADQVV